MALPPALVFVVEDDRTSCELVGTILRGAGYEVAVAHDGREALALLDQGNLQPVVILTDLMMPVMSGWQFASLLRSRKQFATVPVVLISGNDKVPPGQLKVFDRCLRKPVAPPKLLETVAEFALRAQKARNVLSGID